MKRSTTCLPLLVCFPVLFLYLLSQLKLWPLSHAGDGKSMYTSVASWVEVVKVCLHYWVLLRLSCTFSRCPFSSSWLISELRVVLSNLCCQNIFRKVPHGVKCALHQVVWFRRPTVMVNWSSQCKIQLLLWLSKTRKFFHAWEITIKTTKRSISSETRT